MAAPRPRRVLKGLAALLAVAALWAGAWGLHRWAPFTEAPTAVTWPEPIQPLAEFVEDATSLPFLRPVAVEWVTDTAGVAARTAPEAPTADERATAAAQDAAGRALGLWAGEMSSIAADAQVFAPTSVAYWLTDENVLLIGAEPDDELSPRLRSEIVFELAIALDDQHFDLIHRSAVAPTRQESLALAALALGDAMWVYGEYYDRELRFSEREEFDDDVADLNAERDERTAAVPSAYQALVTLAPSLGPTFIAALRVDGGSEAVQQAMADPPIALDQVTLPATKYLHRDPLEAVSAPTAPAGSVFVHSGQGGPAMLFLMLTTGLPANDALTAADGWGNDAYTVYRMGEQVCIDIHLVADSRRDADLIDAGLTAWARARPAQAHALIGRDGVHLFASACDPGTAVRQGTPSQAQIDQLQHRAFLIRSEIESAHDAAAGECVGRRIFAEFTTSELNANGEGSLADIDAAADECGAAAG